MTQGILIPYLIIIFSSKHFPLLLFQVSESVQLKSNQKNVVTIFNYFVDQDFLSVIQSKQNTEMFWILKLI